MCTEPNIMYLKIFDARGLIIISFDYVRRTVGSKCIGINISVGSKCICINISAHKFVLTNKNLYLHKIYMHKIYMHL